jgi:hypothetical protein
MELVSACVYLLPHHLSFLSQEGLVWLIINACYASGLRYEVQSQMQPTNTKLLHLAEPLLASLNKPPIYKHEGYVLRVVG